MKTVAKKIAAIVLLAVSLFVMLCSIISDTQKTFRAYADASDTQFAESYVMDDLKGMTIDGKQFNIADYSFSSTGETNVLQFVEYCYSYDMERQQNYNLYVYVHNPKGKDYVESSRNGITLRVAGSSGNFKKYGIELLSVCEETNYERLFYKYGVELTDDEKALILANVSSGERIYEVGELVLVERGAAAAVAYAVGGVYRYSGYAKGYGANTSAASTLSVTRTDSKTLTLDVKPTFYRPTGTNGKNEYTQDTLHSVYFAVPKSVEAEYGNMSAVHATWLSAYLAPYLVTGNQAAFTVFSSYLGIQNSEYNSDVDYMYVGGDTTEAVGSKTYHYYGYLLNPILTSSTSHSFALEHKYVGNEIDVLYQIYNSGSGTDSADNYTVSSEDIFARLKGSATAFGGELVNEKYAACMFESVDEAFTEVNIQADEEYSLTSQFISPSSWWEKLFGGSDKVTTATFDGIKAIYAVQDSDVVGSVAEVCQRLYISEGDYESFKSYYNDNKAENTIYLFRYRTSDFISQEATLYEYNTGLFGSSIQQVDSNAFFAQQAVDLDFDIIDVTLKTGKKEVVLPVVMSPLDIVHDGTPPVYTTSDVPWWEVLWNRITEAGRTILTSIVLVLIAFAVIWILSKLFKKEDK